MLLGDDRISFPGDVTFSSGVVSDAVRHESWPVNAGGAYVLTRAGDTLATIAVGLAATYGIDKKRAEADVASFVARLNRLLLLNVCTRRRFRRWFALAIRLLPLRALPEARARRIALTQRRMLQVASALAPRAVLLAVAVALPLAAIGLLTPVAAAIVGGAAGTGVVVHEAAHVAALGGRPAALVLCGCSVFVLHPTVGGPRGAFVALAGPSAPAALGLLLVSAAVAIAAPTAALAGALLALHALCVTAAARDGRTACGL
jgi:hypothetical protein